MEKTLKVSLLVLLAVLLAAGAALACDGGNPNCNTPGIGPDKVAAQPAAPAPAAQPGRPRRRPGRSWRALTPTASPPASTTSAWRRRRRMPPSA